MAKAVIDLRKMTPDAIKSHILSKTATRPLTIYPMFAAVGFVAWWFIFNAAWFFTLIGGLSFVGGLGYFLFNYFGRYDFHQNEYFVTLRAESKAEAQAKLKLIQNFLSERDFEQGSSQVKKLQDKMQGFQNVLEAKFEPGEMAHARYLTVASEAQMLALENLEQVVVELKAIDHIDLDYLQRRYDELTSLNEANDGLEPEEIAEAESLKSRMELHTDGVREAEKLMSQNEVAMTEIDKLTSKLARAKTSSGDDVEDGLQKALDRLKGLGEETDRNFG